MYDDTVATDQPMHEGRDLPFITLREIDLPEVRVWEVGGKYFLVIGVEMTGKRERKYSLPEGAPSSDENKIDGDFKITSVQLLPEKEANKMEREAFEGALAKARGMK
jgi:hypothetical protein